MMKKILFYKFPSGRSPAKEAQKVTWVLMLIEEQERVSTINTINS